MGVEEARGRREVVVYNLGAGVVLLLLLLLVLLKVRVAREGRV